MSLESQPQPQYAIRIAKLQDISTIDKINRQCMPENYDFGFFYRIFMMAPSFQFVVYDTNTSTIVGYAMTCKVDLISSMIHIDRKFKEHSLLISIAVLPEFRQQGLGRLLMEAIVEKNKKLVLQVRKSNTAAVEMYKKYGLVVATTLPKYYKDQEDAYCMTKD